MLIKNETRTEIEKKNFRKLRRRLEIIDKFWLFFWFIFYEGTYRKNTLKILSSNFCVDAAKNGAQYWTALPCMLCMQSMDPTAGFVVVHKLLFSCFFIFIFFLLVYLLFFVFFLFVRFGAAVFGVHASRMICFKAHKAKLKFVYFVSRRLTHF